MNEWAESVNCTGNGEIAITMLLNREGRVLLREEIDERRNRRRVFIDGTLETQ